jgi:hypothetical protein
MTLASALDVVWERLHEARDAVHELHRILDDRPPTDTPKLVEDLVDAVDDVQGRVEAAISPAASALAGTGERRDLDRVRRELASCQREYVEAFREFLLDVDGRHRRTWLASLGRERRGEWEGWVAAVDLSIDRCRLPLFEADRALGLGWEELAWQTGATSVSVHATGIGQQLSIPDEEGRPTAVGEERGR